VGDGRCPVKVKGRPYVHHGSVIVTTDLLQINPMDQIGLSEKYECAGAPF
jgi:hypothetical protein